jgi:hypothetical protein
MISRLLATFYLLCYLGLLSPHAEEQKAEVDLCKRLEQSIQGRKHGFLAGNLSYYVGGFHASWRPIEDETLGLTHPFHHDLRSRGVGLLESKLQGTENTGTGNDYMGWEFYKDTRVLYGSVIFEGAVLHRPVPTRMFWRPDKMICEYDLGDVLIREEKFIGSNDAAASIITSSKPVTLQFEGHSFFVRHSVSSSANIRYQPKENALVVTEGGTIKSRPDPDGLERVGPCVYQGMTTVLSCTKDFSKTLKLSKGDRGEEKYLFEVPCDSKGVTVSWAMNDEAGSAVQAAKEILSNGRKMITAKTEEMNRRLYEDIPRLRCSDPKFEEIYYYLWSIYLMYYIDVQKGWEMENHTQSAVNNFLGIHRYDACFQIKVGAWTADKPRYAYGNVLTWKHLVESGHYRETPNGLIMLSDNKGIGWHSGSYGAELSEHVLGAWQIYQHTGDLEFLRNCYEGYFKKVFWKRIVGFAMNDFEVGGVLEKMAELTGHEKDGPHWRKLVRNEPRHIRLMFDQRWEANGHANFFMGPKNGMLMTNAFWSMRSKFFPREYAKKMINAWALNKKDGFYGDFFPLAMAKKSMNAFASNVDHSFGYTPDTAYFTLDGMFRQGLAKTASELTINHLENYNFHKEWNIPVAPEAYQRDLSLFGDQYSNFNAGKILLFIEGLAGISYSLPDRIFQVRDAMPTSWGWLEVEVPVGKKPTWVKVRIERQKENGGITKKITIENCPLSSKIEPWLEERKPVGEPKLSGEGLTEVKSSQPDRKSFQSIGKTSVSSVSILLK